MWSNHPDNHIFQLSLESPIYLYSVDKSNIEYLHFQNMSNKKYGMVNTATLNLPIYNI